MWLQWIGVGAAVVSALAAVATGIRLWRESRRRAAELEPIVECGYGRQADGSVTLDITIRNRLPEAIELTRARLIRPGGALITDRLDPDGRTPSGFARATSREIGIGRTVPGNIREPGEARVAINIQSSPVWRAGPVRLDLWTATRSAAVRETRITVRRVVEAPTAVEP